MESLVYDERKMGRRCVWDKRAKNKGNAIQLEKGMKKKWVILKAL